MRFVVLLTLQRLRWTWHILQEPVVPRSEQFPCVTKTDKLLLYWDIICLF